MERAKKVQLFFAVSEAGVILIPVALRMFDRSRFMAHGDPLGDLLAITFIICLVSLLLCSSALLNSRRNLDRFLAAAGLVTVAITTFLSTLS